MYDTNDDIEQTGTKGSSLLYLLIGAALGSLIALLFAPRSGDETRETIAQKARDAKEYAQQKAQEAQDRAGALIEQGKQVVSEKVQQTSAAVDAGREAYTQEIARGKAAND